MSGPAEDGDVQGRHAALAAASRVRLMSELRGSSESLDVEELASRTRLHRNTVRFHLRVLAAAGLVERRSESRGNAGRPRFLYTVTPAGDRTDGEHRYRALAGALAAFLDDTSTAAGMESGEQIGRFLGERMAAQHTTKPIASSKAALLVNEMMKDLGFESELHVGRDSYRLMLHHCPYADLAMERRDIICGLHRGLLQQVVDQMETPPMQVSLHPFVAPRLCVADLTKPGVEPS